jgi:hypothetical protein
MIMISTPRQSSKSSFYYNCWIDSKPTGLYGKSILEDFKVKPRTLGWPFYNGGWGNFKEEYDMQFYNSGELYYEGGILKC